MVVLPTDTVYGVASDPWDDAAVTRLLAAKGRDEAMPPPVLVPGVESIADLAHFDSPEEQRRVEDLARRFWPGPLTIVVRAQQQAGRELGWDTARTGGTVALRMPDHPLALQLLREAGPLAVTSANKTGAPPAQSIAEARAALGDDVASYLDGGPARLGVASTIVDATGPDLEVLREGTLTAGDLGLPGLSGQAQRGRPAQ